MRNTLVVIILLSLCGGCTKRRAIAPAVPRPNPCLALIDAITPYTAYSRLDRKFPGMRPASEEEARSICAPGPCAKVEPVSAEVFAQGEERWGKTNNADRMSIERYGEGQNLVIVAIIDNAKVSHFDSLANKPVTRIESEQKAHVTINGRACGTWDVYRKQQ